MLGQAVRIAEHDVPALAGDRVAAHVGGPVTEVRHVVQLVNARQRGRRVVRVEDRADPGDARVGVSHELIGDAAVADLELGVISPFGA